MSPYTASPGEPGETVEQVRRRFLELLEAGIVIASEHSLDAVLRKVVETARTVVGARYAALGVISPEGDRLTRFEIAGMTPEEVAAIGPLPVGHGILGLIVKEARPLRIPRISDDPRRHGFPPNHPPMESLLGVPIRGRQRVFGNLYLTEKIGASEFSAEDERIAVLLAARASVAIETALLLDEQAQLLEHLHRLQRQRDQFFAMINHELRNALTGVYGWAEQLQRARSPATAERAGKEILESAERTITLLNNLLDLSRLDAGRIQVTFKEEPLAGLVERAIRQVRPLAEAKDVAIVPELDQAPAIIDTDPIRLDGILVNLLSNAVRHSPRGERIVVRAAQVGGELVIHVIDRGAGIAHEDQVRIFEPFIRVDPESGLGSGLGLAVSRRMAELLGGRLTVASDPGRGATFTVTLSGQPSS